MLHREQVRAGAVATASCSWSVLADFTFQDARALELIARSTLAADAQDYDHRPQKRLKDLSWPPEPNAGLWDDPLQRDDVKPLRGFELQAVGAFRITR